MVLLIILQRVPYIGKGKISRYSEHGKMTGSSAISKRTKVTALPLKEVLKLPWHQVP